MWHSRLSLLLACVVTFAAPPVAAEVFKCTPSAGKVEYRDYPCDGGAAAGEKVDARANTIGTGESLDSIRARNARMKQRMDTRRSREEQAAAREHDARERAFYEERAHRDRQAIADAVRESNNGGAIYWPGYVPPRRRIEPPPPPVRVPPPAIVTRRKDG